MRIHLKYFPPEISAIYQIHGLTAEDGYVYTKITKCMYGLKQAYIIDYNQLIFHMETHGYHPLPVTTELWDHKTRRTNICLCVDDFGVKYFNKYNADHLL